jgi:predicted nucleic acid binding AN1-type Zn finger protein
VRDRAISLSLNQKMWKITMPKCDHCGEPCDIPFNCSYCGGAYCSTHRLPPSHNCINENLWRKRVAPKQETGPEKSERNSPGSRCHTCGMELSRAFYCPQCGYEFCSIHKYHNNNHSGIQQTGSPRTEAPPVTNEQEHGRRKTPDSKIFTAFAIAFILLIGAVVALGSLPQEKNPATNPVHVPGQVIVAVSPTSLPAFTGTMTATPPLPSPEIQAGITTVQTAGPGGSIMDQPATGTIISGSTPSGGPGALTLDNSNGESDAVVVLVKSGGKDSLVSYYIREGDRYRTEGVKDGSYDVYVSTGDHWISAEKKFGTTLRYYRFEKPMEFKTTITTSNYQKTVIENQMATSYTVHLAGSLLGNTRAIDMREDNFPAL